MNYEWSLVVALFLLDSYWGHKFKSHNIENKQTNKIHKRKGFQIPDFNKSKINATCNNIT